jgi:hypothetical protein
MTVNGKRLTVNGEAHAVTLSADTISGISNLMMVPRSGTLLIRTLYAAP